MGWHQTKIAYYADFAIVPILILAALLTEVSYNGVHHAMLVAMPIGLGLWTLVEYWIHRVLFHHFFRRQHWCHHLRSRAYDTISPWVTAAIQVTLYAGLVGSLGMAIGTGLFIGLNTGYLAYFMLHDAVHHGHQSFRGWLGRKRRDHMAHHAGREVNFGLSTTFWDQVFGTYWR